MLHEELRSFFDGCPNSGLIGSPSGSHSQERSAAHNQSHDQQAEQFHGMPPEFHTEGFTRKNDT